jgi:hypothetical protein
METMIIETKITITNEAIESMLVTAIEGGSNYWYEFNEKDLNDAILWHKKEIEENRLIRNESIHYYWMDAMLQGYPKPIPVYDTEELYGSIDYEEFEPIGFLSMKNIKKGLEKASVEYPKRFNQFFPEYESGDADDADVLFQLVCLGDVVYG